MTDKTGGTKGFRERGGWWVVAQGVLFAATVVAPKRGGEWPPAARTAASVFGVPLAGAGAAVTVAGFRALGDNLTAMPHPKDDAALVEDGIYRVVRHPIYSGFILAALGAGLLTRNPVRVLLGIALFVFFDAKSRREEAWLTEKFPAYLAYRQRVKKLLPGLY